MACVRRGHVRLMIFWPHKTRANLDPCNFFIIFFSQNK